MTLNKAILLVVLCTIGWTAKAQKVDPKDVYEHISYLADDKLKGRRTGSRGAKLAGKYIVQNFKDAGLEPYGNRGYYYEVELKNRKNPHDLKSKEFELIDARNIVGFLNNDAEYTIVVGGHYDHLGLGHDNNSLEANSKGEIHNGADDNASGVAGIIELAYALSENNIKENYNFLFIAFTGEELGLLGSKKWCDDPTLELSKVNCMFNMDMIGRLDPDTKRLLVSGTGTSDKWLKNINASNNYFSLKLDSSGTGPSDHTSFYNNNIPVLHFFSGQHSDYHKPSDDIEKINLEGTVKIIEFIYSIIMKTNDESKLKFYKTKTKMSGKKSAKFKVTLGIMPDYTADVTGLRIDGIIEDRPAEKAGILRGDIILKMGEVTINDIYDYMKGLAKFKKGQTAIILINREGKEMNMEVTF